MPGGDGGCSSSEEDRPAAGYEDCAAIEVDAGWEEAAAAAGEGPAAAEDEAAAVEDEAAAAGMAAELRFIAAVGSFLTTAGLDGDVARGASTAVFPGAAATGMGTSCGKNKGAGHAGVAAVDDLVAVSS